MDIVDRLKRWMLLSEQPEPLSLDHEAQVDIANAADEITRLRQHVKNLLDEDLKSQALVDAEREILALKDKPPCN